MTDFSRLILPQFQYNQNSQKEQVKIVQKTNLFRRFRPAVLLFAVAITASLGGCAQKSGVTASSGASSGSSSEPFTVNVSFATGMTGIGNQFGIAKGLYKQAGITLSPVQVTDKISAFASGAIDLADGDPGTFVPAASNGVPFKIVANMWRSTGAYWIIANNNIKTFSDLKGKTVGTATASGGMRVTTMEVLSKNGINPNKDVSLVADGNDQSCYAALLSGQVDATIIHQPFASLAEKAGTGHALAKTWEYVTDYDTGAIVASNKLIQKHPDYLQRLLNVYFQANEYARTHSSEFVPWAAQYLSQDTDVTQNALDSEKVLWTDDPIVDPERLTATQKLLVKYNFLPGVVSVKEVVDNRFAEVTAKKLKLGKYAGK